MSIYLTVAIFDRRVVFAHEYTLHELNSQCTFADATAA